MLNLIHLLFPVPVIAFLLVSLAGRKNEKFISATALAAIGLHLLLTLALIGVWISHRGAGLNFRDISLYHAGDYDFFLNFYFDHISAVYLLVGNIITFVIIYFSRIYMHRESGFKRFFYTVLFFYTGYLVTVLAGNFETLFIGWEILGVSSFLLIAFYRKRYLPVKNALTVFAIYRIGDVGILMAMWMAHHLFHRNVPFITFFHEQAHLSAHPGEAAFIGGMILLAALAKSAQLPFSGWLPRAMEGPTPSSAIFYGSLSVHIGAFLLLRTFPIWEHQTGLRIFIAATGLLTAFITTLISRVQPTVKGQIAYSSAAQIGIIFIEIAAGWDIIALIHFTGNAFLRTYQLLVSPSMVTYFIREQFYNYVPATSQPTFFRQLEARFYLLSLREWYLDKVIFHVIFRPLKKLRVILGFLTLRNLVFILGPVYLLGSYLAYGALPMNPNVHSLGALGAVFLALLMAAKSYNERQSARLAWVLILAAHFFIDLGVTFNDPLNVRETAIYLAGVVISGITGYVCLEKLRQLGEPTDLQVFHGAVNRHKALAFIFLVSSLGMAGFPVTSTFLGEDLVLSHIDQQSPFLALLVSLTFIVSGISVIRIYARVFLGSVTRNYQKSIDLTI